MLFDRKLRLSTQAFRIREKDSDEWFKFVIVANNPLDAIHLYLIRNMRSCDEASRFEAKYEKRVALKPCGFVYRE